MCPLRKDSGYSLTPDNASRLILSDWAANSRAIPKKPQALVESLLLLALVYDEILITDEVFALNTIFANHFAAGEQFRVIEQLIETGAIVVLTHPLNLYPDTGMRERATVAPIRSRAEYIAAHGTSGARLFKPTTKQVDLYSRLDGTILRNPKAHRPVSERQFGGHNVMEVFALLLHLVLEDRETYGRWLHEAFPEISEDMRSEFLRSIEDPHRAYERIHENKGHAKTILRSDTTPVFNRSLAYQLSSTFSLKQARQMQRLIQTVFAAPFNSRENAIGQYSEHLKEFVTIPNDIDTVEATTVTILSSPVIVDTAIDLHLPSSHQDFCGVIQTIRNNAAGKELRRALRNAINEHEFARARTYWQTIAEELANHYYQNDAIRIRSVLCSFLGSMASAVLAQSGEQIYRRKTISTLQDLLFPIPFALTAECVLLGGGLIFKTLQNDLRRQKLSRRIETALKVRCSDTPIPQDLPGC